MSASRTPGLRRLAVLFQGAREPVFLLDSEQRLTYVNPAWEALTGQQAEAVSGLLCQPQGPGREGNLEGIGGSFCPPPEALQGHPAAQLSLIVHTSGERVWRRVEYWPWHNHSGSLRGILGVISASDAPGHAPDAGSQQLRAELALVREQFRTRRGADVLLGRGPAYLRLLDQVSAAASSEIPVLIVGEPGTGKRSVARVIHASSPRASSPFLLYDCAALPPEVLERELFGTAQGNSGLRSAEGGTIVLAEAIELPRDIQSRLVMALREPKVRLVATSSAEPDLARREDRIRDDFYFALTGLLIRLAPLRERLDELPLLAQHLLERANLGVDRRRSSFSPEAIAALLAYDWPGNLRELGRVVSASHARGDSDLIQVGELPAAIRGNLASSYSPPPMPIRVTPLDATLEQLERRLIEQALQKARQNKSRAAEILGISRPRLYRRIKELGIPDLGEPSEEASPAAPTPV